MTPSSSSRRKDAQAVLGWLVIMVITTGARGLRAKARNQRGSLPSHLLHQPAPTQPPIDWVGIIFSTTTMVWAVAAILIVAAIQMRPGRSN